MGMMGMMGQGMGGPGGMRAGGMMPGYMMDTQMMMNDPKTRGQMLEIHGRMRQEIGQLMEQRGNEIEGASNRRICLRISRPDQRMASAR
jgi:hypothetical protein